MIDKKKNGENEVSRVLKLSYWGGREIWVALFVVICMTLIVYLPALKNDFVTWDDGGYVYENSHIRLIDIGFLKWVFTPGANPTWHPLTLFSFAVDHAVWGLDPFGYHLTNLLFHVLNAGLVLILVMMLVGQGGLKKGSKRFNKKALISGIVTAVLFGITPVHVESVAWVSERKDVLCAFFFLLSLIAYLRYVSSIKQSKPFFYGLCLISFMMALISKPMGVSLPIVLLIIDFFPLRRLKTAGGFKEAKGLLVEKLPFFLLSSMSSLMAIWAQSSGGALQTLERISLMSRIFVAVHTFAFYLVKMALPFNLAPFYPYPMKLNINSAEYLGPFVFLIAIILFCLWLLERRLFASVWLYYVITLLPVIGIVKVGSFAAADRYMYLPSLSPFLLIGLGTAKLLEWNSTKQYMVIVFALLLFLCGLTARKTFIQIALWHDSVSLFSHEIKLFPDVTAVPYINRGKVYNSMGEYKKAIEDFNMAIKIDPREARSYNNRGNAYHHLGDDRQAVIDLNKAIELNPKDPTAYYNLGVVFSESGTSEQALVYYKKAAGMGLKQAQEQLNKQILGPKY